MQGIASSLLALKDGRHRTSIGGTELNRKTYLSYGIDVDIILRIGGMWHKRLDQKLPQHSLDGLNLLLFSGLGLDPSSSFRPGLVKCKEATLAASLDQLIGFGHESSTRSEQPRISRLCLVEDGGDSRILGKVQ